MLIQSALTLALSLGVAALPQAPPPSKGGQTGAAPFKADLRVDTNRDGKVDVKGTTDIKGKDAWDEASGALFLPNIGNTDGHCSNGCDDATVEKQQWAPKFQAPMQTVPMEGLSDAAVGTISVQDPKARSMVRIFLDSPELLENPPPIDFQDFLGGSEPLPAEKERYAYLKNDTPIPAAKLRQGLTLFIDGRQTRSAEWDGRVAVDFTVKDGDKTSTDKVMLRVAPVVTHHHLQPIEKLFTTNQQHGTPEQVKQRKALLQPIESDIQKSMQKAGIKAAIEHVNASTSWAQDLFEPAYASMPGPNGPVSIRINIYGRRQIDGRTDETEAVVFNHLRGEGVGAVTANLDGRREQTLEAGGNIETIPPYEFNGRKFPSGRVVIGGSAGGAQVPQVMSFFKAQQAQDPIVLDSSWLYVKHVDEMINFLPAKQGTKHGWRVVAIDPSLGLKALETLKAQGQGATKLFSHPKLSAGDSKVPTVAEFLDQKQVQDATSRSAQAMQSNIEILKKETGVTDADIVRVPAVIAPTGYLDEILRGQKGQGSSRANSAFPSQVNGVPLSDSLFMVANPFGPKNAQGEDVLQKLTAEAFSKAGFQVDFIDDWELHKSSGDLHCYTNTYRATR
ncbi:arginine deiminase type-3 [Moelleriella libera RCEF 2490]|uniref:Arginine deiminase type-3 n=1 Tax=Moelleriella libera RCEF 2490 TaxID=1081109 RepID=A0A168AVD7_9HYPO|nr:arginine deiminase type-3 [Moelleriella libera RCEF 2490]